MKRKELSPSIIIVLLCVLTGFQSLAGTVKVATASRAYGAFRLDGLLNDELWRNVVPIGDIVQQDPHPEEETPYKTEVYIAVTERKILVGIKCFDPEPDKIHVHTLQRDGNCRGDDNIALVFDTFGDRRRGYYFQVNAGGARVDGLVLDPEFISMNWDGTWNAKTAITSYGWSAEIEIPAQIIRFNRSLDRWGFNFQRFVARDRITLRWSGISLDARLSDLRRAGVLEGVGGLKQGVGLSFIPYGMTRSDRDEGRGNYVTTGDLGGDISYSITPDLTAAITVNTDFAETEVDNRRINLTRFALFFPEKRSFFLEGSDLFNFGAGLHRDFIPFFSRRIGLYEDEVVPIEYGARVLGHIGKLSMAMLDVVASETEWTDRTNLFAGRLAYDVGEHLTVGTIATHGNPDGVNRNYLSGFDAIWQTSTLFGDKNFSIGAWYATSGGDIPEGQKYGYGVKVDYPNDLWDVFLVFREFGDALYPALGFLPRPGTRWYSLGGAFQPRPSGGLFDWVRQFYFELYTSFVTGLDGRVQSWRVFTAPFNASTESGEHLEANYVPQFERLDEPFEVAEGVVIAPGDYRFTRYRVEAQSSRHRPWRIGSTVWFGGFYTGTLIQWESFLRVNILSSHLMLSVESENDFGYLPEGNFVKRLYQLKSVLALSPDLNFSSYIQYDTESRNLGLNARFRWTISPGNNFYIVWNKGWNRIDTSGTFPFEPIDNHVAVKLKFTFRI